MKDVIARIAGALALAAFALTGCISLTWQDRFHADGDTEHFKYVATQIEYADVDTSPNLEYASTIGPRNLVDDAQTEYWNISLEEAVRHALEHTKVMRDLGGIVIRTPDQAPTTLDPGIQETDPQVGVAAALSAFDASFASNAFFEYNDRSLNNAVATGVARNMKQDLAVMQTQIAKRALSGTEFILRNNTDYDANNTSGNDFRSVWNTNIEAEVRHPLLFGGGTEFNRIAGSSSVPGVFNGVLIARLNVDSALSDFEIAVRDFVSNLENAYWDLYFAYRDLEAKIKARDSALRTWQTIKALEGRRGGEPEKETQAREQYYRFKEEVQNALNGRLVQGTQTNNGSRAGTFRGSLGVFVAERRLRLLMELPITDHRLLRPSDTPPLAEVVIDWDEALLEALTRRAELRKQKWQVKRRELELVASRRHLLPSLDLVGRYRWRGFGKDLFRQHDRNAADALAERTTMITGALSESNNAFDSLINGNNQEWQLGVELSFPIGYRQAHAGVRNAELRLARARTLLREQERDVVFGLSNAVSEMKRAHSVVETNYRRRAAAEEQVAAVKLAYENETATIDVLLESQRRKATADSAYYRALSEHAVALKNMHFEKGSLLEFNDVQLAEGLWPVKAYWDAKRRHQLESRPLKFLNPFLSARPVVSEGDFPQSILPADADEVDWNDDGSDLPPTPASDAVDENPDLSFQRSAEQPAPMDERPANPLFPASEVPTLRPTSAAPQFEESTRSQPLDFDNPIPDLNPNPIGTWSGSPAPASASGTADSSIPFRRPSEFWPANDKRSQRRATNVNWDVPFRTPQEIKQLPGS